MHGTQSAIANNAIVLDGRPTSFQPLDKIAVPLFFKAPNLTDVTTLDVTFCHYGALHVVTLKNNTASRLEPLHMSLISSRNNTKLLSLTCHQNKINAAEMEKVINALLDRTGNYEGSFTPIQTGGIPADENICTKVQVTTAKNKNWRVTNAGTGLDYEGS